MSTAVISSSHALRRDCRESLLRGLVSGEKNHNKNEGLQNLDDNKVRVLILSQPESL